MVFPDVIGSGGGSVTISGGILASVGAGLQDIIARSRVPRITWTHLVDFSSNSFIYYK
jgi:hypothetical protein